VSAMCQSTARTGHEGPRFLVHGRSTRRRLSRMGLGGCGSSSTVSSLAARVGSSSRTWREPSLSVMKSRLPKWKLWEG